MADVPVACTLTEDALRVRKDGLLARVAALSAKSVKLATGYRLEFPASSDVLTQVAAMIDAERQCCRFLRFTLTIEPDLGPMSLELTGPDGTQGFLAGLFDPA